MYHSYWRRLGTSLPLWLLLVALACTGCAKFSKGKLSGKVYFRDKLVKGGNVTFSFAEGTFSSRISEDGTYKINEDVPVGSAMIGVETESVKPTARAGKGGPPGYQPPPGQEAPGGYKPPEHKDTTALYTKIDDKFGDPKTSGRTYEVKSGVQEFDVKIP